MYKGVPEGYRYVGDDEKEQNHFLIG